MGPRERSALGLGLVMIAGLLYTACAFATKAIEESGVSPLLLTYLSTCLFVLHLPFDALVRCVRGKKLGFRELPGKDKSSDGEQSPAGSSPRQWKELEDVAGVGDGTSWNKGGIEGGDRAGGAERLGKAEGVTIPEDVRHGRLLMGPERSSGDVSNQAASCPQTPVVSVLDTWKVPPIVGKSGPRKPLQAAEGDRLKPPDDGNWVVMRALTEKDKTERAGQRGFGSFQSRAMTVLRVESGAENAPSGEPIRLWAGADNALENAGPESIPDDLEAAQYEPLDGLQASRCKDSDAYSASMRSLTSGSVGLYAEHLEAAKVALVVGPLWFLAQYVFSASLTLTSVTSNTILFTCTSLFTFIISVLWLREPFTLFKLAMIACAMIGTALVSISDAKSASGSNISADTGSGATLGNCLTLLSALIYAFYGTSVKYMLPDEQAEEDHSLLPQRALPRKPVSTSLVFGYMGLLGGVLLLPCLVVLHFAGAESLQWMGGRVFGLILVKGVLGNVVADYLCARAMLLTTPTSASVGLAFQTPVAIVADLLIYGAYPKPLMLFGGLLVIWGFFGINLDYGHTKPRTPKI